MRSPAVRTSLFLPLAIALLPFTIAHATTFTTALYKFTHKADGATPMGGVIEDAAGTIYGETYTGGTTSCTSTQNPDNTGCGTVYSYSATGVFTVLATFTGPNGAHGNITLTLSGNTLYGATEAGGANDDGVVFSVNTDGSDFTVLHQFAGTDGEQPAGNLIVSAAGTVYGITDTGGAANYGVFYSISKTGAFNILHTFSEPSGGNPTSLIAAANGTLVGTTNIGGSTSSNAPFGFGAIFTYVPATNSFQFVYNLPASGAQGYYPYVSFVGPGPTVYGANYTEAFSLSLATGLTSIGAFDYYTVGDGATSGPIRSPAGRFYGILDGDSDYVSELYTIQNGQVVDLAIINPGLTSGTAPLLTKTGLLLGTSMNAGLCTYCGAIWSFNPSTQQPSK